MGQIASSKQVPDQRVAVVFVHNVNLSEHQEFAPFHSHRGSLLQIAVAPERELIAGTRQQFAWKGCVCPVQSGNEHGLARHGIRMHSEYLQAYRGPFPLTANDRLYGIAGFAP